ncbi:hypothetical protein Leryth_018173 [Lithospermum erythrorhizon]|nr:hypothetical protein Leryth_018173 [Lithospermum erythrorhizon]
MEMLPRCWNLEQMSLLVMVHLRYQRGLKNLKLPPSQDDSMHANSGKTNTFSCFGLHIAMVLCCFWWTAI